MNRKKILVVDNNKLIIKLMTSFLKAEGHEVVGVDDAFSALDILKEFTPEIAYIDLVMPKIGGDSLCKIFRTIPLLAGCYIVIISAAAVEQQIDYIQFGADACIAKGPFSQMCNHIRETITESDDPRCEPGSPKIRGMENLYSRQITKELLSENRHLQIILDSMSQGVIEIVGKRVSYANPAALFLLQVSQEKLLGSYLDEILGPEIWEQLVTEICAGEALTEGEKTLIRIHGRHIIPQCLKIKEDGMNRIILLTDITERKRMETIVEATNLSENLGYIFSGIRHEIGNPVNSIKMALTVLSRNIETYDKVTVAEFVDRSLQEVIRIEYLLKALKNFSLFESPDMRKTRLDHFMENFIPLVQDDLKNRAIELKTIIGQGVRWVYTDTRALHHILLNLLTNAADAVEGRGSPRIIIGISRSPPWVKIKVDDNGSGISESDKKNLFKPFFTSKAKGSGLGLVIVKKMLLKMNGTITIESDANFGTTVTLTLPEGE